MKYLGDTIRLPFIWDEIKFNHYGFLVEIFFKQLLLYSTDINYISICTYIWSKK